MIFLRKGWVWGGGVVKRAANHIFSAKAIFCCTGPIACLQMGQSSQPGEVGGTRVLHPRSLDLSLTAFPRPQTMPPLSQTAALWETSSAPGPARGSLEVSASAGGGHRRLWEGFPLPNTQRTRIQGIFGFWCLFFKPTCSLGSAGKQDILREGKWSREEDSAAALAGSPRPLLRGGRSRRRAPSGLRRGGQPLYASVPSRGVWPSLPSPSSEAQAEVPTQRQQLRPRTPRAGLRVSHTSNTGRALMPDKRLERGVWGGPMGLLLAAAWLAGSPPLQLPKA